MTTTKLSLYNGALRILGEYKIASLSESREAREVMDDAWDDGAVDYCLSEGQWTFATRSSKLTASTSIEPDFGYAYAFEWPSDYVITSAICSDEYYTNPLLQYEDEALVLYTNYNEIYVKYVSNDSSYGGDYAKWPISFVRFVETYLAYEACIRLTQSKTDRKEIEARLKDARNIALNHDRRKKPTTFAAPGNWVSARMSGNSRNLSRTGSSINVY